MSEKEKLKLKKKSKKKKFVIVTHERGYFTCHFNESNKKQTTRTHKLSQKCVFNLFEKKKIQESFFNFRCN